MVAHDMTKYKSTTNRFKLRLTNQTSICAFQDPDFPSSMHRFRDLFEISNDINVDNFQLLDVIGRVVSYQKPTFVPKLSTKMMDFRIADTDWDVPYDLNILTLFWTYLRRMTLGQSLYVYNLGKLPEYMVDEIKVSNSFHITKVTVNGDSDVFHNFLNRMTPDVSASQNNLVAEEFNDVLALFKNSSADENKFWVDATIAQIETKGDLWYPSCRNCFKKMPRDPRNRRCFICGEENFSENFSGCANMLMWDGQCITLIGKSAKYIKQLNG
ncbi:hypothetical protein CASFOL_009134 [Castilleja foliolosa]|uniref:Uncharacterized protein n=1 Tax=Castilleja foliolosa TaxID=1961234 RepID=A0ABD3DY40_9LAMI